MDQAQSQMRRQKRPALFDEDWTQANRGTTPKHARLNSTHSSSSPYQPNGQLQCNAQQDVQQYHDAIAPSPSCLQLLQESPDSNPNPEQQRTEQIASNQAAQTPHSRLLDGVPRSTSDTNYEPNRNPSDHNRSNGLSIGNEYSVDTVSGHARVHFGNAQYHCGPGSQLHGPSKITGNMTVNNTHFHTQMQASSRQGNPQDMAELELKKALYYDQMDHRKFQLDQVDPASFEWLWTHTSFRYWLRQDDGVYWIQGKPASGKSTLINYLVSKARQRVIENLEEAHLNPSLLYFFFDFRAGGGIANTIVGLLRSLLLQLVKTFDPVKQYLLQECGYQIDGVWSDSPNQLLDLFRSSLAHMKGTICVFIDGLDEFTGDFNQLGHTIVDLQEIQNLKVCIASRPHAKLSYRLGPPALTMQQHNAATVRAYAEAAFSSLDSSFSRDGMPLDQDTVQEIVDCIDQSADGVVLWAKFAVDEVITAVIEGARLEDAATRLDQYPSELSDIYDRVLSQLDRTRKREAGVILFIITYWNRSFGTGSCPMLELGKLLMSYNRIMYDTFGIRSVFISDTDQSRFRVMVQNILQGLVNFVLSSGGRFMEPRLIHKSFDAFIRGNASADLFHKEIESVFASSTVGPQCLALNLVTASDLLKCYSYFPRGRLELSYNAFRFEPGEHPPFSRGCIPAGIRLGQQDIFRESDHNARILLTAVRTHIYRDYSSEKGDLPTQGSTTEDDRLGGKIWHIFPQIFTLIFCRQWRAFDIVLEEELKDIPELTKDWLRGLFKSQIHQRLWELEQYYAEEKLRLELELKLYPSHYVEGYEEYKRGRMINMFESDEEWGDQESSSSSEAEASEHESHDASDDDEPSCNEEQTQGRVLQVCYLGD